MQTITRNIRWLTLCLTLALILAAACLPSRTVASTPDATQALWNRLPLRGLSWDMAYSTGQAQPPILVSIVMHNEEPPRYPDFVNNQPAFWQHRNALVQFVDMLYANGVMFNYQSDWNFLTAAGLYDTGTPSTNGKNVVRYIKEDLGFEVDPHAHETLYNYADVAYLIEALGVTPSQTTGGYVAHPPEQSKLEYLWQPITGRQYPTYTWQAEITWGGGTKLHQNEEPLWASGVWKPKDKYHFLEHDAAAPLPNVGNYGSQWENLDRLLQLQQDGELEDKIHTCTISVRQDDLLIPGFIQEFEQRIQAHDAMGDIRWVGLAEVVDIWQTEYDSEPNILRYLTPRAYLPLILKNYTPPPVTPTPTPTPEAFQLQHLSTVTLTTDEEGGGARPELVYANGRFFVVYLGNIMAGSGGRAFKVKVFDRDFTTEITARDLVTSTAEYGGPTDIRVTSDGESLYAFYETASPQQGAHLFAAKYALTDDFPLLAYTAEPIATGPYWHDAEFGDETLDDPASVLGPALSPAEGPDSVFVMTKIRAEITPDADTVYRLRELTTDLVPIGQPLDLDVSDAADGPAQVNSLLYVDGSFYAALPTTIAPMCGPGGGPDVADHDLMMIRFDDDWTFNAASDVWTLSDCPEVERYVSGFDHDDDGFYVAYHATPRTWTCEPGGPPPGPGPGEIVWLKVFDDELNPVDAVKVSGAAFGNHPAVEVVGDLVYVAYGYKETQDASENVVVEVYQKVPREEGYQPQFCGEYIDALDARQEVSR